MTVGINAPLTTFVPSTNIASSPANSNFSALNNGGVSNDSGSIYTSGIGDITCNSLTTVAGYVRGIFFLSPPYQLILNSTINSGNTNVYSCTGVGAIPSGPVAVLMNAFFTPSAAGTFCTFTPHGTSWSNANYPLVGTSANNINIAGGTFIAVLDTNGQLDVRAANGNCLGIDACIYGYIF